MENFVTYDDLGKLALNAVFISISLAFLFFVIIKDKTQTMIYKEMDRYEERKKWEKERIEDDIKQIKKELLEIKYKR